ncbi:MAG: hypothetical protein HQ402_02455 [Parcubacteria group bacterium]|nr:hypothetical protein [Parcubacteria group bacterium]
MSFLFNKPEQELALILDIGSGSVAASLVLFSKNEMPRIFYISRMPISIDDKPDSKKLLSYMTKFLDEAMKNVKNEGIPYLNSLGIKNKHIENVFCVFSSPWCISKTSTFKEEKNESIFVSKKYIDDVLTNETNKFETSISKEPHDTIPGEVTLIEKNIIQTKLNGYKTSDPYSKEAKSIEMSIFMSLVSWQVLDKVEETVNKFFHVPKIVFHSFTLSSFSVVSDIFLEDSNFLLMDITGEVTDVSLIKNGVIVGSTSFSLGRNFLLRKLASDLNTLPEIATSYLMMYNEKNLEPQLSSDVDGALKKARQEWILHLKQSINKLSSNTFLPLRLYVTLDEDIERFLGEAISEEKIRIEDSEEINLDTILLSGNKFGHFVNWDTGVHPDPFLAINAIFFNKLFHVN